MYPNVVSLEFSGTSPEQMVILFHLLNCHPRYMCENLGNVGSHTQLCHWGVILWLCTEQLHVSACDGHRQVALEELKNLRTYSKFLSSPRQPDDGHHRPKLVVVQCIVIKLHHSDTVVFDYPHFPNTFSYSTTAKWNLGTVLECIVKERVFDRPHHVSCV